MRLIIHAGMHKTGSSSIQETFAALTRDSFSYAPFTATNHSGLFEHLTSPYRDGEIYHGFAKSGVPETKLERLHKRHLIAFRNWLRSLTVPGILSAEDIGGTDKGPQIEALHAMIARHKHVEPEVLIYVRPPHSFMESAFQQRVKGGDLGRWRPQNLWPKYRARVETLDRIFGRDRVTVRAFHPWEFPDKDVVQDFAGFVGVTLDPSEIRRTNEGLSAEAAALIYIQRKFGNGLEKPGPQVPRRNIQWAMLLNTLGTQKLRFADTLVAPVLEGNRADLDWIEERIGRPLEDRRSGSGPEIASEEDLIRLGLAQVDRLEALLREKIDQGLPQDDPQDRTVKLLESLRALA